MRPEADRLGWQTRIAVLAVQGLVLCPGVAAGQPGRQEVAAGNRLYEEGRYEEAHEQYMDALREAPDSPVVPFNDGNALYQSQEFERATEAYRNALEHTDPDVSAQAWYNLGNALYRQQQLDAALDAYKEALRLNPTDTDAKHNLEMTLEQLRSPQPPSSQSKSESDRESPDDRAPGDGQEPQDAPESSSSPEDDSASPSGSPAPPAPDDASQPDPSPGVEQPSPGQQEGPSPDQAASPPAQRPTQAADGTQDDSDRRDARSGEPSDALTPEEAERLLRALDEDPGQIQRQHRTMVPTEPPRRPW